MTAIQKEADEYIHLMRQSKMDAIREYIEKQIRIKRSSRVTQWDKDLAGRRLIVIKEMFTEASSNSAPLP